MREILFRGKRKDNGEWVYGYYVCIAGDIHVILTGCIYTENDHSAFEGYEVIPETVGQYMGRKDMNGKKIFEGDIIKCTNYHGAVAGDVQFYNGTYYLACSSGFSDEYLFNCSRIEVIGNIPDNPELFEDGE